MSKKPKGAPSPKKLNPGIGFELAVAQVQKMLDANSVVTHNEFLTDRLGNERQFDVVIRGTFGGYNLLGVIECKDHGEKIGPTHVEAFSGKAESVGASFRIMVSRHGFTESAMSIAKHDHIGAFSLLPQDCESMNPAIFIYWYRSIYTWGPAKMCGDFAGQNPTNWTVMDELQFEGIPLANYYRKLLIAENEVKKGTVVIDSSFKEPLPIVHRGEALYLRSIRFSIPRKCQHKRKRLALSGTGFFDWDKQSPIFPKLPKSIMVQGNNQSMEGWEDLDGDLPKLEPYQVVAVYFIDAIDDQAPIPSLAQHIETLTVSVMPS